MNLRLSRALIGIGLVAFVFVGVHSITAELVTKPLPEFVMEDYGCYARALTRANAGGDPYADRELSTGYLYPPPALLWVNLFEQLHPWHVRFAAFATASIGLLSAVFWLAAKHTKQRLDAAETWTALPLVFLFMPVLLTLYIGQVNAFVAFFLAGGYFLSERKPWIAGACIACGALLKVTPAFLLALFLRRRFAKLWGGLIVTSILASLITGFVWGFHHYLTYLGLLQYLSDAFPVGTSGGVSLINALYLIAGKFHLPLDGWEHRMQQVITLSVIVCSLVAGYIGNEGPRRDLAFAAVCIGLTVMPNVLWVHHFAFMLAAILVIIFSARTPRWLKASAYVSLGIVQLNDWIGVRWQKLTTAPSVAVLFVLVLIALWIEPAALPTEVPAHSGA